MKIDKVNGQFNTYKLEVSFGELMAIRGGLETTQAVDPIVDEMRQGIDWYLDNLPGPGEDKEDFKAKKEAENSLENPEDPAKGAEGATDLESGEPGAQVSLPSEHSGPGFEPGAEHGDEELDRILQAPPPE